MVHYKVGDKVKIGSVRVRLRVVDVNSDEPYEEVFNVFTVFEGGRGWEAKHTYGSTDVSELTGTIVNKLVNNNNEELIEIEIDQTRGTYFPVANRPYKSKKTGKINPNVIKGYRTSGDAAENIGTSSVYGLSKNIYVLSTNKKLSKISNNTV